MSVAPSTYALIQSTSNADGSIPASYTYRLSTVVN